MPCWLCPLTSITIMASRKQPVALSTTPLQPSRLLTLPREILDAILSHLTNTADLVCLALSHQTFLAIYRNSTWEHKEALHGDNAVRLRLDRDVPVLYYCARCNCANIPCLSHSLENITISSPAAGFRIDRCQHNAYMGYISDGLEKGEDEMMSGSLGWL